MMQRAGFTLRAAKRVFAAVRKIEGAGDPRPPSAKQVNRNPPQQIFAVRVSVDGGAAGSPSTTCSWTYTATSFSGYEYGTGLTPTKCRYPNVPYVETADDTVGAGFFDEDGEFVLWDAGECAEVEEC